MTLPAAPRVGLVEDDPRLRRLLELELQDLGAEVIGWGSAEQALAEWGTPPVELLLLEMMQELQRAIL